MIALAFGGLAILPAGEVDASPVKPPLPAGAPAYTVLDGDFLVGIAGKLRVSLSDLLATNQLTVRSVILPGDRLAVPKNGVVPVAGVTRTQAATKAVTTAVPAKAGMPAAKAAAPAAKTTVPVSTASTPPPAASPAPSKPVAAGSTAIVSTRLDSVVAFARAQVGKPYVFFTAGPDTYDCSGLTMAAYLQAGIQLIHQSQSQSTIGVAVDWHSEPIRAGDLIFTAGSATPGVASHVGIATSDTKWIQAPRPNDVVKEGWRPSDDRILAVRRLIAPVR